MMKKLILVLASLVSMGASAQVINCPSGFNSTAGDSCGVSIFYPINTNLAVVDSGNGSTPSVTGSQLILAPAGADHTAMGLIKHDAAVNVQAFDTKFKFVMNGENLSLIFNNTTTAPGFEGNSLSAGAGGEANFYQGADCAGGEAPNNIFALEFDAQSYLSNSDSSFTYSSVQWYQPQQVPYNPVAAQSAYCSRYATTKLSTSPVPLNSPSNTSDTTTGDVMSAEISYDGNSLSLCMYDVTAANGSCSSSTAGTGTYFTHTWTGVDIPGIVGGDTAWVMLGEGTGSGSGVSSYPLDINSWVFTVNTPTGTLPTVAWNASSTYNIGTVSSASPTLSLAPGTYSGTQSVTVSTSTTPNNYNCYAFSSGTPAFYPHPDSNGGCSEGTYLANGGTVSVSGSGTLYAVAGSNNNAFGSGLMQPTGLGPPSPMTAAAYTIAGTSAAATPTFSLAAGSYSVTQSLTLATTSSGAVICYTTNGITPVTNGSTGCTTGTLYSGAISVATTETVKAVAGGTSYSDSTPGTAAYTINQSVGSTLSAGTAMSAGTKIQ